MAVTFFIAMLAETNRAPFDLPEAEAEIVAGYNIEYSSMTFALFFLGEYGSMYFLSAMFAYMFLGGWLPPLLLAGLLPGSVWFILKTSVINFMFIFVRANFPRYRYDQLMAAG
jgi:NADH-quinone oxidoreductase subunit H